MTMAFQFPDGLGFSPRKSNFRLDNSPNTSSPICNPANPDKEFLTSIPSLSSLLGVNHMLKSGSGRGVSGRRLVRCRQILSRGRRKSLSKAHGDDQRGQSSVRASFRLHSRVDGHGSRRLGCPGAISDLQGLIDLHSNRSQPPRLDQQLREDRSINPLHQAAGIDRNLFYLGGNLSTCHWQNLTAINVAVQLDATPACLLRAGFNHADTLVRHDELLTNILSLQLRSLAISSPQLSHIYLIHETHRIYSCFIILSQHFSGITAASGGRQTVSEMIADACVALRSSTLWSVLCKVH